MRQRTPTARAGEWHSRHGTRVRDAPAKRGEHREPLLAAALGLGEDRLASKDVAEDVDARIEDLARAHELPADGYKRSLLEGGHKVVVLPKRLPVLEEVLALCALPLSCM